MRSLMLLVIVCGFGSALCDKSSEEFILDRSLSHMTTYITTESSVYHMEMDQYHDGNILFSDKDTLRSTDGNMTLTVAGQATEFGYKEGAGETARFNVVTGFYQISSRKVVVADYSNHCLRLIDRVTRQTQTFSGTCTKPGYADGKQALFDFPYSIIADNKNQDKLLVTDQRNKAVRHVDIYTRDVSTFFNDTSLDYVIGITQEVSTGDLFLTSESVVYQLNYRNKEFTLLAGSPTQAGYKDGSLSASLFNPSSGLLLIENGRKLLITDWDTHRVRVIDRVLNTTYSLCTKANGHTDGDMTGCSLLEPESLMVSGVSLYIGGHGRIRKLIGQKHPVTTQAPTSTSTLMPRTSSTMYPCPPSISKQLDPGQTMVDVEISSDQSLQLPSGNFLYKLRSELTNCTVSISVTEAPLKCSRYKDGLSSSKTGLGELITKLGDTMYKLSLPIGQYKYQVIQAGDNCTTFVRISDYRIRRRLEFVADYTVDCSIVNSTARWRLLEDVAKQRYTIIEALCGSVCKRQSDNAQPILSCGGVEDLKIRWPTDIDFPSYVVSVPADIRQSLEKRIRAPGVTLNAVVVGATPPIVYPRKAATGGYLSLALSTECLYGLTYSDVDEKCV